MQSPKTQMIFSVVGVVAFAITLGCNYAFRFLPPATNGTLGLFTGFFAFLLLLAFRNYKKLKSEREKIKGD